jgi:hypothetical protein
VIAALVVSCALLGSGPFVAPDNACTPGVRADGLTRTVACTPALHPREYVTAAVRRAAVRRYGLDPLTFRGELDHRVPVFLLGRSTLGNLWPEAGAIPNLKDRLEFYVYRRVCFGDPHPMRVRTAAHIFTADWRSAYRRYLP